MTEPVGDSYQVTSRTVPTRHRDRAEYDRELAHSILDDDCVCHLGFLRDGAPVVLPTLYTRVGDALYLHGSTGSRPLRQAGGAPEGGEDGGEDEGGSDGAESGAAGIPVCVTVTRLDGLVLARSAFSHSLNYRSVVVHGTARQVTDAAERTAALDALVDQVVPGRAADCRPADAKELAATAVLRVPLEEVSAKVRTGAPGGDSEDAGLPYWSGVVPVTRGYGAPVPAPDQAPETPLPDYLAAL